MFKFSLLILSVWSLSATATPATTQNQLEGNATLLSLDAKTPALGQALAAGSVPVVLTAAQLSTLTPTGASGLTDTQLRATAVPVSLASLPLPSGAATSSLQSTINSSISTLNSQISSVTSTVGFTAPSLAFHMTGKATTAAPTYTDTFAYPLSLTGAGALRVDGSAVTQPVSGPLTDTQLRASAVPVSLASLPALAAGSAVIGHVIVDTAPTTAVTGTFYQATQPVSVADGSDVTLGTKTDAKNSATDATSMSIMSVLKQISASVQSPPTQAVTLATAPALVASSAVIGHVIVDTAPTTAVTIATAPVLVAGSAIIGKVGIDQTTPGTTNGVQVNAALPAGANVIGHVIADTGSTTAVTGTVTANATLSAETTKVIGTVNQGTSPWVISGALTDTQLRASAVPVSLSTLPALVAGSAVIGHVINDASSAVIGHVINDSGSTTAVTGNVASTVADGANVVLGAKADAKSTATDTTAITMMSVLKQISASVQAPPSQAVTATLGTETTKVIGTVNISAAQSVTALLSDGTNAAKVTAASTAAAAADKAVVVSQNPSGGNPCTNPTATLTSITGATSGTSNVQIIALSGSTKIYICSLTVIGVSGTSPTFSLLSGTGSNCASTAATVLQAWTTAAGTLYAFANPVAVSAAGSALCYKGTGTTPVQNYAMTYVQQ